MGHEGMVRHSLVICVMGTNQTCTPGPVLTFEGKTQLQAEETELQPCGHQDFGGLKQWLQFPLQTPAPSSMVCLKWLLSRAEAVSFLGTVFLAARTVYPTTAAAEIL